MKERYTAAVIGGGTGGKLSLDALAASDRFALVAVPRSARSSHQLHLEHLAAQIDRATADYHIAESSLAALELCEAAYLSSEHRCLVPLPLGQFTPPAATDWRPGAPYAGSGGGCDGRKLPPRRPWPD